MIYWCVRLMKMGLMELDDELRLLVMGAASFHGRKTNKIKEKKEKKMREDRVA